MPDLSAASADVEGAEVLADHQSMELMVAVRAKYTTGLVEALTKTKPYVSVAVHAGGELSLEAALQAIRLAASAVGRLDASKPLDAAAWSTLWVKIWESFAVLKQPVDAALLDATLRTLGLTEEKEEDPKAEAEAAAAAAPAPEAAAVAAAAAPTSSSATSNAVEEKMLTFSEMYEFAPENLSDLMPADMRTGNKLLSAHPQAKALELTLNAAVLKLLLGHVSQAVLKAAADACTTRPLSRFAGLPVCYAGGLGGQGPHITYGHMI